ncbi:large conductance mechanosensitive channel protein MscL [Fodinibius halophilus]|uniref:Large-conductance mechanosensitive channel n=1 Tax=Fodinibius halophilus TaxID=1736908 RepID=A0A6M1T556_9BACT|nr:large conductance mechanosensitive channel protein MscL [Fodinibius halophilus]NGP89209.1 large conductance mechanosensitive channel protein MscL [Fodinibius halophilus]
MFKEFKEFAVRGNVIDMAVGIIIGAAFTTVVQSLVKDILMPPLGLLTTEIDFGNAFLVLKEGTTPGPYSSLQIAQEAGAVVLRYGTFFNAVISFGLVSFTVFLLVRYINKLKRPKQTPEPVSPAIKKCQFCFSDIPVEARRCPHCTSNIES